MITLYELTLYNFTFIDSSKQINQSKKYESRFLSERPYESESETENALRKVKTLYKSVSFVEQNNSYKNIISFSIYIPSHPSIYIRVWIPTEVPSFMIKKKTLTLKLHSII